MLLGEGVLFERECERGVPFKSSYFIAIGSSSVKMVADRRRRAACHDKH